MKNKPNPTGLKNFMLDSPDGSVLDFEIFHMKNALSGAQEDNRKKSGKLGIGGLTVMRLSESLVAGNRLYFDRYFTSIALLDKLLSQFILMRRNVPAAAEVPSTFGGPRESYHFTIRRDGKLCCINWMDNKPALMQPTTHSDDPADMCRRWCRKDRNCVNVGRPNIIKQYNDKMGASTSETECYHSIGEIT